MEDTPGAVEVCYGKIPSLMGHMIFIIYEWYATHPSSSEIFAEGNNINNGDLALQIVKETSWFSAIRIPSADMEEIRTKIEGIPSNGA